jgi:glycosyltransferase involved in cell wall biosynthesis
METKLTIGFITSNDPNDKRSWSGTHFRMLESLKKEFSNIIILGPVTINSKVEKLITYLEIFHRRLFKKKFNSVHNLLLSKHYGYIFKNKIKNYKIDVIFAPAASSEIACLNTNIPICYLSDTSFNQIKDYYNGFSNFSKLSCMESNIIEQKAINKATTLVYPSEWASNYVISKYKAKESKLNVIPLGANIDKIPDFSTIEQKFNHLTKCNLLFLGVDWERKGGNVAFDTLIQLTDMGISATLTVCGCIPPTALKHPDMKVIPYLDKNTPEDYSKLLSLFEQTHFLILPTRAECFGVVFCESSAFGIPSITTDTGGIASAVENGVNGYRLPLTATGIEYANLISKIFLDKERYKNLVLSSRAKYENELNWDIWGKKMKDILINTSKKHPKY